MWQRAIRWLIREIVTLTRPHAGVSSDWLAQYHRRAIRDEDWHMPDQDATTGIGKKGPWHTPGSTTTT